jgi:uncharacterized membrane protein YhaH (DUF805 family)
MNWYLEVMKKYVVFSGRARRKEYWMFVLFNIIIFIVLYFLESLVGGPGILANLYSLAILLPGISVGVRRLHDIGRTGWWILVGFIPVIGTIILLIFMILDSNPGENKYGPNPKGVTA